MVEYAITIYYYSYLLIIALLALYLLNNLSVVIGHFVTFTFSKASILIIGFYMKTIFAIATFITIVLTLGYTSSESSKYQATDATTKLTAQIQKALPTDGNPAALPQVEQYAQDGNSIFSWGTFVSLSLAIIGIVAFRRNTYS